MPFVDVKLNDGYSMPAIAFGTGSVNKGRDIHEYVEDALEHGFSHIDTAQRKLSIFQSFPPSVMGCLRLRQRGKCRCSYS